MPRSTTKLEVAQRFEALLTQTLPVFQDRIYWTIGSAPPQDANSDTELVSFCFMDGDFDWGGMVGGVVDYNGKIRVSFWRENFSGEVGSDKHILLDTPVGLYNVEQAILRMTGNCLDGGNPANPLLLHGLKPVSDSEDRQSNHEDTYNQQFSAVLHVDWAVDFQWDTATPAAAGDPIQLAPDAPVQPFVLPTHPA